MIEYAGTPISLLILHPPLRLAGRVAQEVKTMKEIMEEARAMEKMAEGVRIMAMEEFPLPTLPHLLFQIQVAQFHLSLITIGKITGGQNGESALGRSTTSKSSTPALTSIQVKVTKNVFVTRTQPTTFLQSVLLEMKELRQAQAQAKSESSGQSLGKKEKVTVSSTEAQQRER